jgi:type IV secretion system protein VirD4
MPVFIDRLKEVSPSLAALGDALPTKEQLEDAAGRGELRAKVPMLKVVHTEYAFSPKPAPAEAKPGASEAAIERPLTAADIGKLSSLNADDFSCDFSDIEIPSEKPTDKELQAGVDELLARFGMAA